MQKNRNLLYEKLGILQSLDQYEAEDAKIFRQKLKIMKEIALVLVEEIEALGYVRFQHQLRDKFARRNADV